MSSEPTSPSREPPRVLVLDADAASRSSHADVLRRAGFATREAESAASAELALADVLPHLVLLDPVLPGEDGLGFAGRVRDEHAGTALIALARDGSVDDKVAALAVVDDYVAKPAHPAELVARVRAVLRRTAGTSPGVLRFADLTLNEQTHEARRGPTLLDLTPREFDLLRFLMLNPRRVLTKDQILANVWETAGDGGTAHAVETYVSYLRSKLDASGPSRIRTVRGVGYSLTDAPR